MAIAPIDTFDQRPTGLVSPRVSPGSSIPVCQPKRNFNCAYVAGMRKDLRNRQKAECLVVMNSQAVDDNGSRLAIDQLIRPRQPLINGRGNRYQLERGTGFIHVADGM